MDESEECLRNITGKSIKIVRCMDMQAMRACTWFKLLQFFLYRAAACLPGGHYRLIWWTLAVRTRTQPPSFPSISTWINIYIEGKKKRKKWKSECGGGWGDVLITEFLISERSTAAFGALSLSHTHFSPSLVEMKWNEMTSLQHKATHASSNSTSQDSGKKIWKTEGYIFKPRCFYLTS